MSPRGACRQDRAAPQPVLPHGSPLAFHPLQVPPGEGPAPAHRCHWRTADLAAFLSLFLYTWGPCCEASPAQWPTDRAGLARGFPVPDPSGPQSPESAGVQPSPLSVSRRLRARATGACWGCPRAGHLLTCAPGRPVLTRGPVARSGPGTQMHSLATGWSPAQGQQARPRCLPWNSLI